MKPNVLLIICGLIYLLFNLSCGSQVAENAEFSGTQNGLKISIQSNKDSYLIGEAINVTITLTNISSRELKIVHTADWLRKYPNGVTSGLISNTYKEGYWWIGIGLDGCSPSELLVIPIGKSVTHTDTHFAKEPGNPILVASFPSDSCPGFSGATEADFNDGQYGNWYGVVVATKTIEVKNEIHPDILRALNELEATILSSETSPLSYEKRGLAVEKLHEIGCAAKGTLLRLLRNPAIVTVYEGRPPVEEIDALSSLTSEFFDEEVFQELIKIACDTKNPTKARLAAIWYGKHTRFIREIEVIIPPDFQKWMYQQIATLKNDKEEEIRKEATYMLIGNKDDLERLGLESLLK